ncbi:hypothetical protein [Sagittula sp. S175]|uniref:hypothetical protein n=1 Tax=Sagittula sp. S175 TaxID=3415129 RepID=UPI003C7EC513
MTAATRRIEDSLASRPVVPMQTLVVRFFLMCVGFGLTMSAFGIWMVGSSHGASDMMLMKLGVSLFMLITGMCMITVAKNGEA